MPRFSALRAALLAACNVAATSERARAGEQAAGAVPSRSPAATLRALEARVSSFQLDNGLRFVVCERHQAPIFNAHLYADVGAFDEVEGSTGLAHLLEHLAFKGTRTLGTRDYAAERLALDDVDALYYALRDKVLAGAPPDVVETARQKLMAAEASASAAYEVPNAYGATVRKEGGVGLNAETGYDSTKYYCSLPANKLELWFALEADRLQNAVFRGMYSEKEVIEEERRLRLDNSPQGTFQQAFLEASYPQSNYRRPIIGYQRDFEMLGRREVQAFQQERYGPSSMTIAIAGDVTPERVQQLAQEYFGGWRPAAAFGSGSGNLAPSAAGATGAIKREPTELSLKLPSSPLLYMGYPRGDRDSPDAIPVSLLCSAVSIGRTSPFYQRLIKKRRALYAAASPTFPGEKYDTQALLIAAPVDGGSPRKLKGDLTRELQAVLDPRSPDALEEGIALAKKQAEGARRRALASNPACASALAAAEALGSDRGWRELVDRAERSEQTSPDEVRQVGRRVFDESNAMTTAFLLRA